MYVLSCGLCFLLFFFLLNFDKALQLGCMEELDYSHTVVNKCHAVYSGEGREITSCPTPTLPPPPPQKKKMLHIAALAVLQGLFAAL